MDSVARQTACEPSVDLTRRLEDLARRGVRLWVDDGRLRCSAPAQSLDDDLRDWLKSERETLLTLLTPNAPLAIDPIRPADAASPRATLAQEALLPLARAHRADGRYNV
ncbi:MAG: hypothetical protein EOO76_19920, partial [Novosphingobium sp.]